LLFDNFLIIMNLAISMPHMQGNL